MGSGKSQWVTATLGDVSGIASALENIDNALGQAEGAIDSLIRVANGVIKVVDAVSNILYAVEDIEKLAIEAALTSLEILKDELIKILRQIFDFGLYILPQYESFDFGKVVRNELINPDGIESNSLNATDRYIRVPNKDNPRSRHYSRVRRQGRLPRTDYTKFIQDIVNSFNDSGDNLKPNFDASTPVSGVTIALANNRLALFIMMYLIIDSFTKGPQHSRSSAQAWMKVLRVALGDSETLGKTMDQEKKNEFVALLEQLELSQSVMRLTDNPFDFIRPFLNIIKTQTPDSPATTNTPVIKSITGSGPSDFYTLFFNPTSTIITNKNQITKTNVVNKVTLTVKTVETQTSGITNPVPTEVPSTNTALFADYYFLGNTVPHTVYLGFGKSKWDVEVPLNPVGIVKINGEDTYVTEDGEGVDLDYVSPNVLHVSNSNPITYPVSPTRVVFRAYTLKDPTQIGQFVPSVETYSGVSTQEVIIPKFNRITEGAKTYGDGYRHTASFKIDVPSAVDRTRIANYMGISKSELENRLPLTTRVRGMSLKQFGPDFKIVDLELSIRPQISINSSFRGTLFVNGTEYRSSEQKIGISSATYKFKRVDLGERDTAEIFFISNQDVAVIAEDAVYKAYSEPEVWTLNKVGGKLAAPRITSGSRINVSENIFKFEPNAVNAESTVTGGKVTGITGGPGFNRLQEFGDQFRENYGLGSREADTSKKYASYRLTGTKATNSIAYAVVEYPDRKRKRIYLLRNQAGIQTAGNTKLDNARNTLGGLNFGGNRFDTNILLPWNETPGKVADSVNYRFRVYQANTDGTEAKIIAAQKQEIEDQEQILFNTGYMHESTAAQIDVVVSNFSASSNAIKPNWLNFSLGAFFPLVDPIDERLTALLDTIRESIPSGPYDSLQDWLDVMRDKLNQLVEIFEEIKKIISNINDILQIGGTGFYFLGIDKANGVEGFQQRLQSVPVPTELSSARYVTGIQFLIPSLVPGTSEAFLGTIFNKLPSDGQDNVKVPEKTSLGDKLKDNFENHTVAIQQRGKDIQESKKNIKSISQNEIKDISIRAGEIE